jgi:hypothetical protein
VTCHLLSFLCLTHHCQNLSLQNHVASLRRWFLIPYQTRNPNRDVRIQSQQDSHCSSVTHTGGPATCALCPFLYFRCVCLGVSGRNT